MDQETTRLRSDEYDATDNYTSGLEDTGGSDQDDAQEVETLKADIEQTRSEMSQTIDAIQEKLNPETIVAQAKEKAGEVVSEALNNAKEATIGKVENMVGNVANTAQETSSSIIDRVKQNPVPAAMTGIGLFFLLKNNQSNKSNSSTNTNYATGEFDDYNRWANNNNRSQKPGMVDQVMTTVKENPIPAAMAGLGLGYIVMKGNNEKGTQQQGSSEKITDKAGDIAQQAGEKIGQAGHKIGEKVSDITSGIGNTGSNIGEGVQEKAQNVQTQFEQVLRESPLVVGAAALALGVMVGLIIPNTEMENRLLGETRDTVMDKVGDVTQETIDKVKRVSEEMK